MRRPLPIAGTVVAVLLLLGAPFLGVQFGTPDDRVLPESAGSRQASEILRSDFTGNSAEGFGVVVDGVDVTDPARLADVDETAARSRAARRRRPRRERAGIFVDGTLTARDGLDARFVGDAPPGCRWCPTSPWHRRRARPSSARSATSTLPSTSPSADRPQRWSTPSRRSPTAPARPDDHRGRHVRPAVPPVGQPAGAGEGARAQRAQPDGDVRCDGVDLPGRQPVGLLGFTATGAIDISMPILMFCIAFGLSMDYEVFLLSRIKEEYDRTGDNEASVALGSSAPGRSSRPPPCCWRSRSSPSGRRASASSSCSASASASPC
jgi:putative drug exporter of the RND superfamily